MFFSKGENKSFFMLIVPKDLAIYSITQKSKSKVSYEVELSICEYVKPK